MLNVKTKGIVIILLCIALLLLFNCKGKGYDNEKNVVSLEELHALIDAFSPFVDEKSHEDLDAALDTAKHKLASCKNDYDLYLVFLELLAVAKDAHSQIDLSLITSDLGILPVKLQEVDGKLTVVEINDEKYDFLEGKVLQEINGNSQDDYFDEMRPYLNSMNPRLTRQQGIDLLHYGKLGSSIHLSFLDDKGSVTEHKLYYQEALQRNISIKDDELLYSDGEVSLKEEGMTTTLTIQSFASEDFSRTLSKNILPLISDQSTHLIIDVSENHGGNGYNGLLLLNSISSFQDYRSYEVEVRAHVKDLLMDKEFNFAETISKEKMYELIKESKDLKGDFYKTIKLSSDTHIQLPEPKIQRRFNKITVLCSRKTYSAAEDFVYYAKQNPSIIVAGETTAGLTGQIIKFSLTNGAVLWLTVYKCYSEDGIPVNNEGISPDISLSKGAM